MKRAKNKPSEKVKPSDGSSTKKPRRLGFLEGQFRVPDDLDSISREEIEHLFDGDK